MLGVLADGSVAAWGWNSAGEGGAAGAGMAGQHACRGGHQPTACAHPHPACLLLPAGQLGLGQFVTEECVGRPTPIFGIPQNKCAPEAALLGQRPSACSAPKPSRRTCTRAWHCMPRQAADRSTPLRCCRHALLAAGRVHSLLLTEDVLARHKGAAAPLTMPLRWARAWHAALRHQARALSLQVCR